MKTFFLCTVYLALASCAFPTFVRKSGSDVYLSGELRAGDSARLAKLIGPDTRRLIVRSPGGLANEAFAIAELIRKHDLGIKVERYCASACASILFVAARERELPDDAFVAFHASPQELALRNATADIARELGWKEGNVHDIVEKLDARFETLFRSAGVMPDLNEKLVFIAGWMPGTAKVTAAKALPDDMFHFDLRADMCGMQAWVPDEDGLARIGIKLGKPYTRPDREKIASRLGVKENQVLFKTIDDVQQLSCGKTVLSYQGPASPGTDMK